VIVKSNQFLNLNQELSIDLQELF